MAVPRGKPGSGQITPTLQGEALSLPASSVDELFQNMLVRSAEAAWMEAQTLRQFARDKATESVLLPAGLNH